MEMYVPDIYQKSIYTVNYAKLLGSGIKCLLFDLDNTIIASGDKAPSLKTKDLFSSLKQKGFKVIIFSNSPKSKVRRYQEFFDVDSYANVKKPFTRGFKKILNNYDYDINEIAIIGDQIVTDVLGGNKIGITTILVNPLSEKDIIFTKFNRFIENKIIRKLREQNLFCKGRYYD